MKKFLKIFVTVVVALFLLVLAYAYIGYDKWSPGEVNATRDWSSLKCYQTSYVDCRSSFRQKALEMKSKFDRVEAFPIQVSSKTDSDLTIDICYIPAQNKKSKLLILSSGIHGVEGFAVQQMVMNELITKDLVAEMGVLLIHAMNPYGFKKN